MVLIGTYCEYLICDFIALSSGRMFVSKREVAEFSHNFEKWKRGNCRCHLVSKQITVKRDIRDMFHDDMLHALSKGDTREVHQIYAATDMNFTWISGLSHTVWSDSGIPCMPQWTQFYKALNRNILIVLSNFYFFIVIYFYAKIDCYLKNIMLLKYIYLFKNLYFMKLLWNRTPDSLIGAILTRYKSDINTKNV